MNIFMVYYLITLTLWTCVRALYKGSMVNTSPYDYGQNLENKCTANYRNIASLATNE